MPPFLASDAPPFHHGFRVIHAAASQTIRGGQAVNVAATDGSHYRIQLSYIPNTVQTSAQTPASSLIHPHSLPQPVGTVRVYAMPNGEVGIIVDGSTKNTELTINPLPHPIPKGYAHSYAYGMSGETHILNIGQITVNSGEIGAIDGFQTANLSGPLVVSGTATVDRISFDALLPGASIKIGGDLNTLDVLNGVQLTSGHSIDIGRDLNLINVGQNLDLSGGGSIHVHRFLGTTPQPPKGTATGSNFLSLNQSLVGTGTSTIVPSLAGYIQGNIMLGANGKFTVVGGIVESTPVTTTAESAPNVVLVNGMVTASSPSQITIPNIVPSTTFSNNANFIARDGSFNANGGQVSFIPLTAKLISGTTTATAATANFTGTATPGATVTYTDSLSNGGPTSVLADNTGNYSIIVPLAFRTPTSSGLNVFTVTSTDAFGRPVPPIQTPTVTPLTANLVGPTTTTNATALFTGTASPGATITYTDNVVNGGPTSILADNTGTYTIPVPLAVGPNTFNVTSSDGFSIQTVTVIRA